MAQPPSEIVSWAEAPSETPVNPGGTKRNQGFLTNEAPPAAWFNWILRGIGRWVYWLRDSFAQLNRSTVGREWTSVAIPSAGGGIPFTGVVWSPTLRLWAATSASNGIYYSPDGFSWTQALSNSQQWISVCWHKTLNLFVAISQDGATQRAATSSNGTSWTLRTTPTSSSWISVCAMDDGVAGRQFVAVGGTEAMYSNDGISWTAVTVAAGIGLVGVAYSPALQTVVAVSNSGVNRIHRSPSRGASWFSAASTAISEAWRGVAWSEELAMFVAVGTSGTARATHSFDGTNWLTSGSLNNTGDWTAITWAPEPAIFVAVGNAGTNKQAYSYNGITWFYATPIATNFWTAVGWSAELNMLLSVSNTVFNGRSVAYSGGTSKPASNSIRPTTSSDLAQAGEFGEAVQSLGTGVSQTNNTTMNVASFSLTPGDWDVCGYVQHVGAPTGVTNFEASIVFTSATAGVTGSTRVTSSIHTTPLHLVPMQISLANTTTVYLTSLTAFSGGTGSVTGRIRARRVR